MVLEISLQSGEFSEWATQSWSTSIIIDDILKNVENKVRTKNEVLLANSSKHSTLFGCNRNGEKTEQMDLM